MLTRCNTLDHESGTCDGEGRGGSDCGVGKGRGARHVDVSMVGRKGEGAGVECNWEVDRDPVRMEIGCDGNDGSGKCSD
jgi:hypothetical protein